MKRTILVGLAAAGALWLNSASAALVGQLSSTDTAIAIDATGKTARGNFPAAEGPEKLIDGNTGSKYLNFGQAGTGIIVTPGALSAIESFQLTTANDAPDRDPTSWELYGTNSAIFSTNNSAGLSEPWTLIDWGTLALPDGRGAAGPLVDVYNDGLSFSSYKMVFPTQKNLATQNSMQIAELQMFSDDAGTTGVLAPGNPVVGVHFGFDSKHPNGEPASRAIDQDRLTKYLNFGEERSGIIITNAEGPFVAQALGLTTANDAVARDPASFEVWGTNDVISSQNNTDGLNDENWTLLKVGTLALPDVRQGAAAETMIDPTIVHIGATTAYSSYKIIFPTVKDAAAANSMQIADIQLYVPEPTSAGLALMAVVVGYGIRRRS